MTNDNFLTKNRKNKIFRTKSKKTIEKISKVLYNIDNENTPSVCSDCCFFKPKFIKKAWS